MFDFSEDLAEVEASFDDLPSDRLLEMIELIDREAHACGRMHPKRADRLRQVYCIARQILQQRIERGYNLRPKPLLSD